MEILTSEGLWALRQVIIIDLVLALSAASAVVSYISLKDACRADDETDLRLT